MGCASSSVRMTGRCKATLGGMDSSSPNVQLLSGRLREARVMWAVGARTWRIGWSEPVEVHYH